MRPKSRRTRTHGTRCGDFRRRVRYPTLVIRGVTPPEDTKNADLNTAIPKPETAIQPPDTPRVCASFDWFTLAGVGGVEDAKSVARSWFGTLTQSSGAEGYHTRYFTEDKAIVYEGNHRNEDCWKFTFPGSVVAKLDEAIKGPINTLLKKGAYCTRVDCAVDVYWTRGRELKERITKLQESGVLMRTGQMIRGRGDDHGWTEYIGSRKSDRFIRIYDKGAKETGIPDWWIRFETVLQRKYARCVGPMLLEKDNWGTLSQSLAASAAEPIRQHAKDIHKTVYQGRVEYLDIDTKRRTLEAFVEHATRNVFQQLAMMAHHERMGLWELIQVLGLDQVKPSDRQARHSPVLSDLRSLLDECGTFSE